MRRGLGTSAGFVALLLILTIGSSPSRAAEPPRSAVTAQHAVSWRGSLTTPDPAGCGAAGSTGCDTTPVRVVAAKGSWVTVSVDDSSGYLRVDDGGVYVADGGTHASADALVAPSVTFQQVRSGSVTYTVGVSDAEVTPAAPRTYTATASLSGHAFDREGQCGATSGAEHVTEIDDGRVLPLSVRIVSDPKDRALVRAAGASLVEIYARVGIAVRLSFDEMPLALAPGDVYPYEAVRRHYGGVRPPNVDVVHVMTDLWAGGFADCIGGIAYPERAFSVGSIHYTIEGVLPVPGLPAALHAPPALVAAHEIGHLLSAQHQQGNCAEAVPQELVQPASDGWTRPCTLMGPLAHIDSEVMGSLERSSVRSFARRYGGKG